MLVEPLAIDIKRIPKGIRETARPPKRLGRSQVLVSEGSLTTRIWDCDPRCRLAETGSAADRGDGNLRSELTALTRALGVQQRVHFMGDLPDDSLWQQYVWTDVHCLPSRERTEALCLLEAAIFKRPNLVVAGGHWASVGREINKGSIPYLPTGRPQ